MNMANALTIAGSDSGGGAGIQADLKTFSAFGVHGMVAITSVTAQNTREVKAINDIPSSIVKKQIEAVAEDIGIDAAKTGMLSNKKIIEAVSKAVKKYDFPLIVDPVMVSKSGAYLLREDAIDYFIKHIIPIAYVITPNRYEAERLTNLKINNMKDARKAAKIINGMGAKAVVIKGGHIGKKANDLLYYMGKFKEYKGELINGCTHGTGCSFSAAIAANIAKGKSIEESIEIAKKFINIAIKYGRKIGHGNCPVNPDAWIHIPAEKWNVYEELKDAIDKILSIDIVDIIPEVGTNFVYALPSLYARDINDVAGVEGRIVRAGKKAKMVGEIKFGVSRHLAKAVLKAMEYNKNVRAAINIKYDESLIKNAKKKFSISYYDRRKEPEEIKRKEGATIPWGIEEAIKRAKKFPDIIYHKGDVGKEPMILIFGRNPRDVIKKMENLQWK